MKITYENILNNMKNAYFEKCQEPVENNSDAGIRLQSVASELYSLAVYGDYILKQAFPQTATGKHLDFHASLRDIKRKTPSKAYGEVTFFTDEPAAADIEIGEGVICSCKGRPFIQFETTESGTIATGTNTLTLKVSALQEGEEYNCNEEELTVMVTPVLGVSGVINSMPLKGGNDAESDVSLRNRIVNSYRIPQSGYSNQSVREAILKIDEVLDCSVSFDNDQYKIFVRTKSTTVSEELKAQIKDILILTKVMPYTFEILPASERAFSLTVEVYGATGDPDEIRNEIKKTVQEQCRRIPMDENISLSRIACLISQKESTDYCEISSPDALDGVIYSDKQSYLKLTSLAVNCYER